MLVTELHDHAAALAVAGDRVGRQTHTLNHAEHGISQPGHHRPHDIVLSSDGAASSDEHGGTITMSGQRRGRGPIRATDAPGLFRWAGGTRARQPRSRASYAQEEAGVGITRESE